MPDIAVQPKSMDCPASLPPHVDWIAANQGSQLVALLARNGVELDVQAALRVLVAADPSPGAHGVQWLCDTLIAGGFLWEDVASGPGSKVYETLGWFAQHRRDLPQGSRNLADHASLGALYSALKPCLATQAVVADPVMGARALRRQERRAAYDNSIIVCHQDDLVVAVPTTRSSAQWWGKGTRWCTAADQDNMFAEYNERAPLIDIVLPGVEEGKLQLWVNPENGFVSFMDASDSQVGLDLVRQHWSRLEALMVWAVQRYPAIIEYMPPEHVSKETWMAAVRADSWTMRHMPPEFDNEAMRMAMLEGDPASFVRFPRSAITRVLCARAVQLRGANLGVVPARLRTKAMCALAVQADPLCLEFVPHAMQSAAMVEACVAAHAGTIAFVAPDLNSTILCASAVARNGMLFHDVPSQFRTRDMVMDAISNSDKFARGLDLDGAGSEFLLELVRCKGTNLALLSRDARTAILCQAAVEQDAAALEYVPSQHMTPDMAIAGITIRGILLDSVPQPRRTAELCLAAVRQDSYALVYVPEHMRTAEVCAAAVAGLDKDTRGRRDFVETMTLSKWSSLLALIPEPLRTPAIVMACVGIEPAALEEVPESRRTRKLCTLAMQGNPRVVNLVPPRLLDLESCARVVRAHGSLLSTIPRAMITPELCLLAIEKNGENLRHVPPELCTIELCAHAVAHDNRALRYVSQSMFDAVLELADTLRAPPAWRAGDGLAGLAQALEARNITHSSRPGPG